MNSALCNKRKNAVLIFAWFLVAFCMAAIFYLSHQVAEESAELSKSFLDKILEFFSFNIGNHGIRKFAHGFEYFGLSILVFYASRLSWNKSKPCFTFIFALVYSVSDEIHQYFVPGRACRFTDVLIDCSGAAAGILICLLAVFIINRRKRRKLSCKKIAAK